MNKSKIIVIVVVMACILLTAYFLQNKTLNENSPVKSIDSVVSEENNTHDNVGNLIGEGMFDEARTYLEENKDNIKEGNYEIQLNRLNTLEAYDEYYSEDDPEFHNQMISKVKKSIDGYFTTSASKSESDLDRAEALLHVAFLYSETWSDKELVAYIATKLEMTNIKLDTAQQQVEVFNKLFAKSISIFPSPEAYLKRAWFNSRLLLTDEIKDPDTRVKLVDSVASDFSISSARQGLLAMSGSPYYNGYSALAIADVMDFLYTEKLVEYSEVQFFYKKALTSVESDFLGNLIVQDIIRMNYAASLYRYYDGEVDNSLVTEVISPVANNVRNFSGKADIKYNGILVMLHAIPQFQNQNNSAIYKIFSSYSSFTDIPPILKWEESSSSTIPYSYKLI